MIRSINVVTGAETVRAYTPEELVRNAEIKARHDAMKANAQQKPASTLDIILDLLVSEGLITQQAADAALERAK